MTKVRLYPLWIMVRISRTVIMIHDRSYRVIILKLLYSTTTTVLLLYIYYYLLIVNENFV